MAALIVGQRGVLGRADGQVHRGHVGRRNAEGHAGQLALDLGNAQGDGLGGAGRGRDGVLGCATAAAEILLARAVDRRLGGGHGVDGRHQAFLDAEVVEHDLGDRGQAVGRAAGVGHDRVLPALYFSSLTPMTNVGMSLSLAGAEMTTRLAPAVRCLLRTLAGGEQAGGLDHVVDLEVLPRQLGRIPDLRAGDLLAADR